MVTIITASLRFGNNGGLACSQSAACWYTHPPRPPAPSLYNDVKLFPSFLSMEEKWEEILITTATWRLSHRFVRLLNLNLLLGSVFIRNISDWNYEFMYVVSKDRLIPLKLSQNNVQITNCLKSVHERGSNTSTDVESLLSDRSLWSHITSLYWLTPVCSTFPTDAIKWVWLSRTAAALNDLSSHS